MRTLPALAAALLAATTLVVGGAVGGVLADDEPRPERVPVSSVVEDEGPGTETVPATREDEGPGTDTVPAEPRYTCVDGVCDTYGESTEGPGTD